MQSSDPYLTVQLCTLLNHYRSFPLASEIRSTMGLVILEVAEPQDVYITKCQVEISNM